MSVPIFEGVAGARANLQEHLQIHVVCKVSGVPTLTVLAGAWHGSRVSPCRTRRCAAGR
jgi:hypothetical protein